MKNKKQKVIRYYDSVKNCLIYAGEASNSDYWDKHWENKNAFKSFSKSFSRFDYAVKTTKKYLSAGSRVLEGGCGYGNQVLKLKYAGFNVTGVDYAKKTVEAVNAANPDLDIRPGDVRKLDFEDNFFDGYWSFGVIEHFFEGYRRIIDEMKRVIKPTGYLFVTFPHMSMIRRYKARRNKYPKPDELNPENFYQFALDENTVIEDFSSIGFILKKKQHLSGLKGLKDETRLLRKPLQKIFDSKTLPGKAFSKIISMLFKRFTSHTILLVFQKQ